MCPFHSFVETFLTQIFRWLPGSRILETHIYRVGSYPYDLIAPVIILWRPVQMDTAQTDGKPTSSKDIRTSDIRTVWLRFHPSAQNIVIDTLKNAASHALEAHRTLNGNSVEAFLEIADLRGHVNVFEITGPKANQVIKGALKPISNDQRAEFKQV